MSENTDKTHPAEVVQASESVCGAGIQNKITRDHRIRVCMPEMRKDSTDVWTLDGLRSQLDILNGLDQTAKSDAGKPQYSLIPPAILDSIERVRTYGNQKYHDPDNWRDVEAQRYWEAVLRHVRAAWTDYKSRDEESQLMHIEHVACNLAFLLQFIEEGKA